LTGVTGVGAATAASVIHENRNNPDFDSGQFAGGVAAGLGAGALASIAPIAVSVAGIMAGYTMYKFMKYNSTREPILITPLIKEGKPFITGVEGMETDGLYCTDFRGAADTAAKKWRHFTQGLDDAVELIKVGWTNYWYGDN
jgi:hypothetical protein